MHSPDHREFFENGCLRSRTSKIPAIERRELRAHRATTGALRDRVAEAVVSQYPGLPTNDMHELVQHVDRRLVRRVVKCLNDLMFGGCIDGSKIRIFINNETRESGRFVDYAMTEWGGGEPPHITLYLDAFGRTHQVFARGCCKLVDGIPCSTPLEFLICVLSHELVHVVIGHMQGFKSAHPKRFRELNVFINGAKMNEVTNRSCCSSCSNWRSHDL